MQSCDIEETYDDVDLSEGHVELLELIERGEDIIPLCEDCWLAIRDRCFIFRGIVTGSFPEDLVVIDSERRQLCLAA